MKRLVSALDAAPWTLVGGLRVPWAAYDHALGGGRGEHHVYLDALVAQLKANGVFHPFQFYARGFGDDTVHLPRFARELPRLGSAPAAALEMTFAESTHGNGAAAVVDAAFDTPAERALLPMQSSTAHVQFVVPTSWLREHPRQPPAAAAGASAETRALEREMLRLRPVVVLLPGTGEQGFRRRRHCVAYPLAERGIATAILEGPFYGRRRPPEQAASKLAQYMDLMVLGRSTLDEARALVAWLLPGGDDGGGGASGGSISGGGSAGRAVAASSTADPAPTLAAGTVAAKDALDCLRSRALGCGGVVLAGTSMGGLHAAMAACHLPPHLGERTGVVSWLGPPSAAPVFTLGALRTGVAWGALARHADLATPAGSSLEAHLAAMEAALPPDPPGVDHAADVAASEAHQWGGEALATLAFATHRPRVGASGSAGCAPPPVAATAPSAATAKAALHPRQPTGSVTMAAVAHARRQLARMSRLTHLTLHPPPLRADAAIFTRAAFDQYIPVTRSVQAMWRHIAGACSSGGSWGGGGGGGGGLRNDTAAAAVAAAATWRGCELRTIRGGHVSASIFQLDEYCRCVVEAVRRLQRR